MKPESASSDRPGSAAGHAQRIENSAPASYTFPPEWAPHDAVWLGWARQPQYQDIQLEMIRAMLPHVQIRILVTSEAVQAEAEGVLQASGINLAGIAFYLHPVANFWIRDAGPRFLTDGRSLAVADFAWNWYGYPQEICGDWDSRRHISSDLARQLGIDVVASDVVAEGGGLEVSSSVIITYKDTALQRNPGLPLETIEAEYLRVYSKQRVIWLERSPLSDRVSAQPKIENYVGWGANGHIDEYVRFVNDTTILIAQVDPGERDLDPLSRADYTILQQSLDQLRAAVDVDGRPFEVVPMPVPTLSHYIRTRAVTEEDKQSDFGRVVLREFEVGDEVHFVPALSYLNFFITNGIVFVPTYWREGLPLREREKDALARSTLQRYFPDRQVIAINPLVVNWEGGGMHCMTQQQPRVDR